MAALPQTHYMLRQSAGSLLGVLCSRNLALALALAGWPTFPSVPRRRVVVVSGVRRTAYLVLADMPVSPMSSEEVRACENASRAY